MKSVNTTPGGSPSGIETPARPGESQARLRSVSPLRPRSLPHPSGARQPAAGTPPAERAAAPHGGPRAARPSEEPRTGVVRRVEAEGWRCLDSGRTPGERRRRRARPPAEVSIAQLSSSGDLLRQSGPDAWLPDAADFMHRMSGLLARGLGFERCRSVCLKGQRAVLSVAEAGTKRVAVTGPMLAMTNVLRRAGLE